MSYEAWGDNDDNPFEAAIEAGWHNPEDLSQAVKDVWLERDRQIHDKKFSPEHDDTYTARQLIRAAVSYAQRAALSDEHRRLEQSRERIPHSWPWDASWWKPKDRRTDLVRAAALLIAEIERMDRAEGKP